MIGPLASIKLPHDFTTHSRGKTVPRSLGASERPIGKFVKERGRSAWSIRPIRFVGHILTYRRNCLSVLVFMFLYPARALFKSFPDRAIE